MSSSPSSSQALQSLRASGPQPDPKPQVYPGSPSPLGVHQVGAVTHVAVASPRAEAVELVVFDTPGHTHPSQTYELRERTGPVWHGTIRGLPSDVLYGFRAYGPYAPKEGHRFNPNKVLLDPYARAIGRGVQWHDALYGYDIHSEEGDLSFSGADSAPYAPLGRVVDTAFDWQGDAHPRTPLTETIIYEAHVKDLTQRHPGVEPALRGTYLGVAADPVIEHLLDLGITAVELMPVHARVDNRFLVERGLVNHWGYNTLSFFAPEPSYRAGKPGEEVREFKEMVRRLHAAGLEVYLDVVYNHTAEGSELGPTLSFRGLDNRAYYTPAKESARHAANYTGTGNTMRANHPLVVELITNSLRYWVNEMHVDGFRFDLAASLARDPHHIDMHGPLLTAITQDPVLREAKLLAEPWDIGPDGYQVGGFPWPWAEWNGKYRDTIRRFWRGDAGVNGEFATRVSGSSDLYQPTRRRPLASVNFITAHDGFTLQDLVSYHQKHNHANGEDNRDGNDNNHSSNSGIEGPTQDPTVVARRETRKRSLITTLMLSQGVPMILSGDELSHTKGGNNNTYCQDNDFNWLNWNLGERRQQFLEFVKQVIHFRKSHPTFRRAHFLTGKAGITGVRDAFWWHPQGREMEDSDWERADTHAFGLLLHAEAMAEAETPEDAADDTFLVLFNTHQESTAFVLPTTVRGQRAQWSVEIAPDESLQRVQWSPGTSIPVPAFGLVVLSARRVSLRSL